MSLICLHLFELALVADVCHELSAGIDPFQPKPLAIITQKNPRDGGDVSDVLGFMGYMDVYGCIDVYF